MAFRRPQVPEHGTEAARVVITHQMSVIEDEVEVVVLLRRRVIRQDPHRAGHAQVHDQPLLVSEADQQVFGPPFDGADLQSRQFCGEVGVHRPAQARLAYRDGLDLPAGQVRRQSGADGFDFGQFGHEGLHTRKGRCMIAHPSILAAMERACVLC